MMRRRRIIIIQLYIQKALIKWIYRHSTASFAHMHFTKVESEPIPIPIHTLPSALPDQLYTEGYGKVKSSILR